MAWLSAEDCEQQTHIRHLQKDLEAVRAEINQAREDVEAFLKETGYTSKLLNRRVKALEALDVDNRALAQTLELLNEDMRLKSKYLLELKSSYQQIDAAARSQLEQYQAQYDSFKRDTKKVDASLGPAAERAPGFEEKTDHGMIIGDIEMVKAGDDGVETELRLRGLQEEAKQAEEDIKKIDIDIDQLEAGFPAFEESLRALKAEKLAEEHFTQTLHERLQQLKDYSQDVACGSCKHVYAIKWEGSEFVIRSV